MAKKDVSLVVLVSGNGSNLQAIIRAVNAGQIKASIAAVISNVPDVYALQRAKLANIPTEVVDHSLYESRDEYDQALQKVIERYQPELVILSGFMRLLTEPFVKYYQGRMLNIHPSLLPKFRGLNTHKRALEADETQHGASVHFVTPDLDSGPVIIQAIIPILEDDTPELLAKRVFKEEHVIYPIAISWFVERRLRMSAGKVMFDDTVLLSPVIRKENAN